MTPEQLRESGRSLWGRQWHVGLARLTRMKPHQIARMDDGIDPVPTVVRDAVVSSLQKRTVNCLDLLRDLGAGL